MKLVLKRDNVYTVVYDWNYRNIAPENFYHYNESKNEREHYTLDIKYKSISYYSYKDCITLIQSSQIK